MIGLHQFASLPRSSSAVNRKCACLRLPVNVPVPVQKFEKKQVVALRQPGKREKRILFHIRDRNSFCYGRFPGLVHDSKSESA